MCHEPSLTIGTICTYNTFCGIDRVVCGKVVLSSGSLCFIFYNMQIHNSYMKLIKISYKQFDILIGKNTDRMY